MVNLENNINSLQMMNNLSIFAIEIGYDEQDFWNSWINKFSEIL